MEASHENFVFIYIMDVCIYSRSMGIFVVCSLGIDKGLVVGEFGPYMHIECWVI